MNKFYLFLILPFILFPLSGCGQWEGGLPDYILAQVDGDRITTDDFDREFKELILEPDREGKGAVPGDLKQACLDQMIERKLLVQEARRLGISISGEELNQAILEIKKDYPGEGFGEKLGLKGLTLDEWKVRLEEKLLAEKMIRSQLRSGEAIDEKEALRYYETHRSSFRVDRKVRARQIVVTDGEEAIQILKRLKKGESFEKVAREKSLGPEKVTGGDLGYFSPGERPEEFNRVFSMETGAVSEVIKSPYGYHIFKVEERIEPREISFADARAGILQELKQKKGEEDYKGWLRELRGKAKVKINKKWLRS